MLKNKDYTITSAGDITVPCSTISSFDSFFIMINNHWFEIPPQAYILNLSGTCSLGLGANSDDYWLLGDVFLKNYYAVHNM